LEFQALADGCKLTAERFYSFGGVQLSAISFQQKQWVKKTSRATSDLPS